MELKITRTCLECGGRMELRYLRPDPHEPPEPMVAGVLMVDLETLLDTKGARDVGRSHIHTGCSPLLRLARPGQGGVTLMNLAELQREAHAIAKDHGWWDQERSFGDLIADVHHSLSKAMEAYRDEVLPSKPHLLSTKVASELVDVVIRVADMAEWYGVKLSFTHLGPIVDLDTFSEWITQAHYHVALACRKYWDDEQRWHEDLEYALNLVQQMAAHYGIDLDAAIEAKMEYNRTRGYRHGGKAL